MPAGQARPAMGRRHRLIVSVRAGGRRLMGRIDAALVPDPAVPGQVTTFDYRRIVLLVAIPAIVLFVPSLAAAGVPPARWVEFTVISTVVGVLVAATFIFLPRGSLAALLSPLANGLLIGILGVTLRPYYHALDLLYPLVVSGHAIVHGLGPGLLAMAVGTVVVTVALNDPAMANWSEVAYAAIYLSGAALLPWTAWRMAQRRAHLLAGSRRESESQRSRLEAVLRSMDDAVIVVDPNGDRLLTNAAYERLTEQAGGSIRPRDARNRLISRSRLPQARAARGESFAMQFRLHGSGGERRWYEARGGPVADEVGVRGGVVVIRDITDRSMRSEQEQFMATASHELRTPIAVLHGYVQLLERRLDPAAQPREAEYAAIALSQTRRLDLLLERLFDLARLQSGRLDVEREPIELVALVRSVCASAEQLAPGRELRLITEVETVTVAADEHRLEQVLLNLIANAINHAPTSQRIDVLVDAANGRATIAVRDYGPGIPEQRLARLLSPRRARASAAAGGSGLGLGLGLFISRELMRAMHGSLEIVSQPGAGTTATLHLPGAR
jgi:PAS domain S-box-containing protein